SVLAPLSLHDALPISLASPRELIFPVSACGVVAAVFLLWQRIQDRYYYRAAFLANAEAGEGAGLAMPSGAEEGGNAGLIERIVRSEEHTSELQSRENL